MPNIKIISHELNLLCIKSKQFFVSSLFFLLFFAIFSFLHQQFTSKNLFISANIIASLSVILAFFYNFCQSDIADGTMEQMLILHQNFELFIIIKILANWLAIILPIITTSSILALLHNFSYNEICRLVAIMTLATLAISFISAMSGVITNHFHSFGYATIIALPLVLPILLISYLAFMQDFWLNYKIIIALAIFIITTTSFATAKTIKCLI